MVMDLPKVRLKLFWSQIYDKKKTWNVGFSNPLLIYTKPNFFSHSYSLILRLIFWTSNFPFTVVG